MKFKSATSKLSTLKWMISLTVGFATLFSNLSFAQQKMDLDDISIKGELHNDERLRLLAREKNRLKNYVKYRTSYRAEMVQGLMRPEPKVVYEPSGAYKSTEPVEPE